MSASLFMSSPFVRLDIEASDGTLWIRSRDDYDLTRDSFAVRLTSDDVAALRIALDLLDTTDADEDAAAEREAA